MKTEVASFAEAWIEIWLIVLHFVLHYVASFAEAWIEIFGVTSKIRLHTVASFAEAWIEIASLRNSSPSQSSSLPSRKRGLKSVYAVRFQRTYCRFLRGSVD